LFVLSSSGFFVLFYRLSPVQSAHPPPLFLWSFL
jgi:hypothetical protein